MKVSSIGGQHCIQNRASIAQKRKGLGFSDLLKKQTSGYHRDSAFFSSDRGGISIEEGLKNHENTTLFEPEKYITKTRKASKPAEVGIKIPTHISDFINPATLNLDNLSDEKKAELNEKYHIQDITPGSSAYQELLRELQKDGVLSDISECMLWPGEWDIKFDENGNITGMLCYTGDCHSDYRNTSLLNIFENLLRNPSARYSALLKKEYLTEAEEALLAIRKTNENIYHALNEIFSDQLNQKK